MRIAYFVIFFVLLGFVIFKYVDHGSDIFSYLGVLKGSGNTCGIKKANAEDSSRESGYLNIIKKAKEAVSKTEEKVQETEDKVKQAVAGSDTKPKAEDPGVEEFQDDESVVFELHSGKTVRGRIRHEDAEYYTVATGSGSDTILFKTDVAQIK